MAYVFESWREAFRRPQLWKAIFAILVAQLVYWYGVRPLVILTPSKPPGYEVVNPRAAAIAEPTRKALSKAHYRPVELPWWTCCHGYNAFAFDWRMDQVPAGGVAIVPLVDADNVQVFVNGFLVHARGRMTIPGVSHERLRTVLFVSPGLVHPGLNRVEYLMVREGQPYFDVRKAPLIGDWPSYSKHYAARMFIFNEYETIGYTIGFILAIIALVVALRSERKAFPFWLFALASTWALLTHFYSWTYAPLGAHVRLLYYFALTNFLPVAILNLADSWSERPIRRLAPVSLAIYLLAMGYISWAYLDQPPPVGFDHAGTVTDWLGLSFSAAAVLRFLWHMGRHKDDRWIEVGIFTLFISLVALDRIALIMGSSPGGHIAQNAPLLLLALALAYLTRNIRLFRSLGSYNSALEARVLEREAELEVAHIRERELVRRKAHDDERRRIMRDMHDGLGSGLMSMLLAARRSALPADRMAEGLQAVIDEMRLILDSMDSVGESLSSALAMFRNRTTGRVQEAGMEFAWSNKSTLPLPDFGPHAVLNIFRILQEAVANALRHSGGKRISVRIVDSPLPGHAIRISVSDDGHGFDPDAPGGRGLANMRSRAKALGIRIDIASRSGGGSVVLDLPPVMAEADE